MVKKNKIKTSTKSFLKLWPDKSAERNTRGMLFQNERKKIIPTQASSSGASFIAFARKKSNCLIRQGANQLHSIKSPDKKYWI